MVYYKSLYKKKELMMFVEKKIFRDRPIVGGILAGRSVKID